MYKYVSNVTETGADPKWLILDSDRTYPEVALQLCFFIRLCCGPDPEPMDP